MRPLYEPGFGISSFKILSKIPKAGSYRGRINSEPENNRKTLLDVKNA